jgi:hypothetical protein
MPEPTIADANATPGGNPDVSISSIDDGFAHRDPSVDAVPTVDIIPAKEVAADATKDAKTVVVDGEKAKPYHQDPDWQRMIKERDDARLAAATANAKLEVLAPVKTAETKTEPAAPTYKDITTMSKEELIEWQEDDPHGYAANLYRQFVAEKAMEDAQKAKQSTVQQTFKTYEEKNADFRQMWDSGKIQEFMAANPGHNAISAHMALTETTRIEAAVAKATKEAEERITKNFLAKRNAQVISDGGVIKDANDTADELKNPQKYGGATSALTARLERMRAAAH